MPRSVAREISVGVVIAAGLALFAVAVLAISQESRMFVPKATYWTHFDNTSGLATGSPVRLVGVQIGTVDAIVFPTDLKETKIKVSLKVDKAYAPRIRDGTVAYLKSLSYLSQDKYIELTPGDPSKPALPPGGYIESGMSAWEETLLQSQSIADDVKEITASLRDLLVAMNRGHGLMSEMIHNPEFGRQGVEDFEASLSSLKRILQGLEEGRGLAGAMLRDRAYARRQLQTVDGALDHLKSVMQRLDDPEGPVAQLTGPSGQGREILDELHEAATTLGQVAKQMNEGKGLVGRLVGDDAYAQRLLDKIDSVAGHADSILGKVDRGEGTLGGIVNDPEVYESLKDIVAGIEKSRIGKGFIRHYGKKGAKARSEEDAGGEDTPDPGPNP